MSCKTRSALLSHIVPVILFLLIVPPAALAQKTDIVHLKNGDSLTVEVKELVGGKMRLSTEAFGTIYVKWEDVERIVTDKPLQVELIDGRRYFGPPQPSDVRGTLMLDVDGDSVTMDTDQIVYIQPIKGAKGLRGNLDNSLSIGFSYTQASDVMQWHVSASTQYRAEKFLASASYHSMVTNNGTGEDSKLRDLGAGYFRYMDNRWLWYATANLQENDELGVNGRVLAGGGVARIFGQSRRQDLVAGIGLAANAENALGSSDPNDDSRDSNTSLEGRLFGTWSYYKLHSPSSEISLNASLFPSLSESDRLRGDARIRYRQEFVKDLFLNLTYYYTFDTDPPAGAVSESDYGLVTSIEYLF